jgi:tetratricopeptide (TPR) repeat protein
VKALQMRPYILTLVLLWTVPRVAQAVNVAFQEVEEQTGNQRTAAAHLQTGAELAAHGKLSEAAEEFVKALELDPRSAEAHYNLGLIRMKWGDLGSAIKSFRLALLVNPHYTMAQLRMANAFTQLACDDERYVGEAIAAYHQALMLDPNEPEAHFNLGFLAIRRLDYRTATEEYEKTLSLDPKYPGTGLALCISVYKLGDFERADSLCHDAVRNESDSATAHHYLGLEMSKREEWKSAVEELRTAVRLDPKDYQAHYALAQALRKTGRLDEAASELEVVRRMQEGSTENLQSGFLENQTRKMVAAGDVDRAIEYDRESLKLKKDARTATNLASALLWKGDTDEAVEVLHQAIQMDTRYAWAHYYLGVALARKHDFEGAVESLTEALKLQPDFPEAEFYIGLAFAGHGRFQDAETHLRSAVRMRPDAAQTHHYLGLVLEQLGKHEEGEAELRTARLLDPNYKPDQPPKPPDAHDSKDPASGSTGPQ